MFLFLLTKGFFSQEIIIPVQDVPVLFPHPADPGSSEQEAFPGPAVKPESLPSDPGSCYLLMPQKPGHFQKVPSEVGPGPNCPLGWQGMEPVGSTSEAGATSPHLVCAPYVALTSLLY